MAELMPLLRPFAGSRFEPYDRRERTRRRSRNMVHVPTQCAPHGLFHPVLFSMLYILPVANSDYLVL